VTNHPNMTFLCRYRGGIHQYGQGCVAKSIPALWTRIEVVIKAKGGYTEDSKLFGDQKQIQKQITASNSVHLSRFGEQVSNFYHIGFEA